MVEFYMFYETVFLKNKEIHLRLTKTVEPNPDNHASRKTCEYAGGTLEAIVDLPEDNDMYMDGERQKCIYRFKLL